MRKREKGFSLIELLIVVAIIMIIAAIAIPNFVRAKISANEASAVSSMHAVATSEIGYSSAYPDLGFSASLAVLGTDTSGTCTPTAACFVDPALASGTKSGYVFTYVPTGSAPVLGYTVNADPLHYGLTGQTYYFEDETNVIHYNPTSAAGQSDPSL
jgi:prepilin-type N-terminal cleavage/methylation domain-containing protein